MNIGGYKALLEKPILKQIDGWYKKSIPESFIIPVTELSDIPARPETEPQSVE